MYQKSADSPHGGKWWEEKQGTLRGPYKYHISKKKVVFLITSYLWQTCLSDPSDIRGLQREMTLSVGQARGWYMVSALYVPGNLLKSWEQVVYLLVLKVLGCIKMRPTTKEPRHNAMHLPELPGFKNFIYFWSIYHLHVWYNQRAPNILFTHTMSHLVIFYKSFLE